MTDKITSLSTARRTQTERRETAERSIIDAAVAIIAERGLTGLTLANAGEKAGYSRGIASHHFGKKDELLIAIVQHIMTEFSQFMVARPDVEAGLPMIRAVIDEYFSRAGRDTRMIRALHLVMSEGVTNPALAPALAKANQSSIKGFVFHLEKGIEKGEITQSINPKAFATLLLSGMRGVTAQMMIDDAPIQLSQIRDEFLRSIERSLTA
jgi:AcrR family transcriptional regulator